MDVEHGSTARMRVDWPTKAERSWCAGASRPRPVEMQSGSSGWTSFFRMQGVVDRFKHGLASQRAAGAPGETANGPEPASLVRDPEAVKAARELFARQAAADTSEQRD